MKTKATSVARVLLGLVFFGFGVNGFLHLFPLPAMEGKEAEFVGGLVASGYFFPLLFVTYTLTGAALLTGRYVPLALTVLAPVVVNVVAIHLTLSPSGPEFYLALLVLLLEVFLAWSYRAAFRPLLRARDDAARKAMPVPRVGSAAGGSSVETR
jgi:hypothetical protein